MMKERIKILEENAKGKFLNNYVERDVDLADYDSFLCVHVLVLVPGLRAKRDSFVFVQAPGKFWR